MKIHLIKNKKWTKHRPHKFFYENSNCFWQKQICQIEIGGIQADEEVFADIIEWENDTKSYQLDIQIPERISITGLTINITNFNYEKLDFDIIEKDSIKIIKNLIKK